MASNQLGSCTVTPGSYLVTFNSIVNINNIVAGDLFRILDDNVFYTIASVNATNLTCTLSSKYFNSLYSLQIFNEVVATSDGTRKFYKSVDNTLVIPGSCSFRDGNSVETFSDNGDGTLTGSLGGTGTVWYDDGSVNLTFVNYVPPAVAIYGSYQYGFPLSQVPFQIIRDYTPHFSWPEPYATDQSHQTITRQALRLIDNDLYNHGARTFEIQVFDSKTNVYVGDGSRAITVPYISSGYLLTDAIAGVHTKGVTDRKSVV